MSHKTRIAFVLIIFTLAWNTHIFAQDNDDSDFDWDDAVEIIEAEYDDDRIVSFIYEVDDDTYRFTLISGVIVILNDDGSIISDDIDDIVDDIDDDSGDMATEVPMDDMDDDNDDDSGDMDDDDSVDIDDVSITVNEAIEQALRIYPNGSVRAFIIEVDSDEDVTYWRVALDNGREVLVSASSGRVLDFGSEGTVDVRGFEDNDDDNDDGDSAVGGDNDDNDNDGDDAAPARGGDNDDNDDNDDGGDSAPAGNNDNDDDNDDNDDSGSSDSGSSSSDNDDDNDDGGDDDNDDGGDDDNDGDD